MAAIECAFTNLNNAMRKSLLLLYDERLRYRYGKKTSNSISIFPHLCEGDRIFTIINGPKYIALFVDIPHARFSPFVNILREREEFNVCDSGEGAKRHCKKHRTRTLAEQKQQLLY